MRDVKMGLTIEEAAEMSGIGRNTMRKLVDWGGSSLYSKWEGRRSSEGMRWRTS